MEQHEDKISQIIVHDQVNIIDNIEPLIKVIRGQQVILDRDLARLYQVETSQLNRQVKRNIERFPEDFMFQLTKEEFENLKCQNGTSSWGGDRRSLPHAFTEQGIFCLLMRTFFIVYQQWSIISWKYCSISKRPTSA